MYPWLPWNLLCRPGWSQTPRSVCTTTPSCLHFNSVLTAFFPKPQFSLVMPGLKLLELWCYQASKCCSTDLCNPFFFVVLFFKIKNGRISLHKSGWPSTSNLASEGQDGVQEVVNRHKEYVEWRVPQFSQGAWTGVEGKEHALRGKPGLPVFFHLAKLMCVQFPWQLIVSLYITHNTLRNNQNV